MRPIPLVYFDKGKAPRVVDPVAFWPSGKWKRAGGPDPVPARQPKRAPVTPEEQAEAERRQAAVQGWLRVGEQREKPRRRAGNAPPAAQVPRPLAPPPPKPPPSPEARERPWWEAESRESCPYFNPPGRGESVVAENNATVLVLRATTALREYLRLHDRGGHLAPWLRDGKRHRVVDARDQAYARGDSATREVAGALLALTRQQLEAVRRASGVSADIGKVKPEGET